MRGREALLAFGDAIINGAGDFECGEMWTLEDGWRAYIRTGTKMLHMPPRGMRKLGESYRDHPGAPECVVELGKTMIECANAAKDKRDRGIIPDGAVATIPHHGRA